MTVKDFSYISVNSANTFYLIINKRNGYIKESNGKKYLMLVPNDENKDTLKQYEELGNNFRYLIKSITNNLDNYDKKK